MATPRKWRQYMDMVIVNGKAISKKELTLEDLKELGIPVPGIVDNKSKLNRVNKVESKKDESQRQSSKLKDLKTIKADNYNVKK